MIHPHSSRLLPTAEVALALLPGETSSHLPQSRFTTEIRSYILNGAVWGRRSE